MERDMRRPLLNDTTSAASELPVQAGDAGSSGAGSGGAALPVETRAWLALIGVSAAAVELIRVSGLSPRLMITVSHSMLNDLLREAGLDLPTRSKIIESIACCPPGTLALMTGAGGGSSAQGGGQGMHEADENGDNIQFLSAAAATSKEQWFWVYGVSAGLVLCAAPLGGIIYATHEQEGVTDAGATPPDDMWSTYRVMLPGCLVFLMLLGLSPWLSMFFVTDTVQERSDDVDFKATMSHTLTSNAAVCAFFSGTIISSLQASSPGDFNDWSLLYQWYGLFLSMALYFAVNAVLMSCLGTRYLAPLNGRAAESFIATNALYFGEPMCGTFYALALMLNAKALWVWGLFGWECGCVSIFAIFFMVVRFLVTLQNLSVWENEEVEEEERSRRVMVVNRDGKTSSIGA